MGRNSTASVAFLKRARTKILNNDTVDATGNEGFGVSQCKIASTPKGGFRGGQGVPRHGRQMDNADKSFDHASGLAAS